MPTQFKIKKGYRITGETVWNVGEVCAGMFITFFDVPFIEDECNSDLCWRIYRAFFERLDTTPIG